MKENILETYCSNEFNIGKYIEEVCTTYNKSSFNPDAWMDSLYMPTPTIIEAAQALYMGHNVEDISRNDASAKNLNQTTKAINKIIDYSKIHNKNQYVLSQEFLEQVKRLLALILLLSDKR